MSDNEIYLLITYIKSVLWRVAKLLSYIEDVRCLRVNDASRFHRLVRERGGVGGHNNLEANVSEVTANS